MQNFWTKLKRPILALAPMANVTDAAFRKIIAKYGKPDVMWTEFVSVEGLLSPGRKSLLPDLWFENEERPIVAQIFGSKPEQFEKIAAELAEMGFDGIDINMGCPDRGVEASGGGAAMIKNPELGAEVIRAAQRGAPNLPVSVKTRLGYNKVEIEKFLPHILETGIAALTVHLRTRQEMSDVPARWELMPDIKKLRDKYSPATLLLGNGDVQSLREAKEKSAAYDIDGVMIGRGIFGNPWFFAGYVPTAGEKIKVMLEHTKLFEEMYRTAEEKRLKNFEVMKKHYKAYVSGFRDAVRLRADLMAEAANFGEAKKMVDKFERQNPGAL